MELIQTNDYQTKVTEELIRSLDADVAEQLMAALNEIPFIRNLISPSRQRAKDRPKDDEGRIIVDLENPHILEDMDYFRQVAIHYNETGRLTELKPSSDIGSPYVKWMKTELDRIWNGMVRPSDGEWVTGYMYWYLNYCPIMLSRMIAGTKRANRVEAMPEVWEGIYWRFHYIDQAARNGKHCAELASRGKSKSYTLASILSHIFLVGDNREARNGVTGIVTASSKEYLIKDGVLSKFVRMIDFCSQKTQFPKKRLKNSMQDMTWKSGYKEVGTDSERGSLNTVIGVTSNDDESKIRGKRAAKILIEEMGCHIKGTKVLLYNGTVKNVEDITMSDVLMGNDGTPRHIMEIHRGYDEMFKITLANGDYHIVNRNHLLYYKKCNWNHGGGYKITEVIQPITEFIKIPNTNKGYYIPKAIIEFPKRDVVIDPYFLGLWLGDGFSDRLVIGKGDHEILEWLSEKYKGRICDLKNTDVCKVFCMRKSEHKEYDKAFRDLQLYKNKHIPEGYKINCPEIQLAVVAGLVDTDGTLNDKKTIIEISQRWDRKHILDDVKFMCECNGLKCHMSSRVTGPKNLKPDVLHYRLRITGDLSIIPTKVIRKQGQPHRGYRVRNNWHDYTFKVEPFGAGEYYGFTTDENHLFCLGDLTVTHNSFARLLNLYNVLLPSVQEGDIAFGQLILVGCVCAGTKVWTHDGRNIAIENLEQKDGIIGYGGVTNNNEYIITNAVGITREPIGQMLAPVKKNCVRIFGRKKGGKDYVLLECSEDHPILVSRLSCPRAISYKFGNKRNRTYTYYFKQAKDITTEDNICRLRAIPVFGNDTLFDARFVGMLIGDGSYGHNETPKYSSEDPELISYVQARYPTTVFASHVTKKGLLYKEMRIRTICPCLREIGIYGQTKTAKRLPINYQTLNKESARLLLSGLYDTDGSIFCERNDIRTTSIQLSQTSEELVKQAQILWRKFGVISSIHKQSPKIGPTRKDKNPWFVLTISGINVYYACKTLDLLVTHKKEKVEQFIRYFEDRKLQRQRCSNPFFILEKVSKIEDIGEQLVYNLSAQLSHTYLANDIITHNTAGDSESDFSGAREILCNPDGYNMYALNNVYDKAGKGRRKFTFFFPGYVNRKGCYNENGVSDVVKALIEILVNRHNVRKGSTDSASIMRAISEVPITPDEAMMRNEGNMFPVADCTARIAALDSDPNVYDNVYTGELKFDTKGDVVFSPTADLPIRDYPLKDNRHTGAIEIYEMPQKDENKKVYAGRYIAGQDPVNSDQGESTSLGSIFVLDLWTDRIVAEYTGRTMYVDDFNEACRKLCLFYDARLNYEQNIKGTYSYFTAHNSTYLLTETLEFLKDKQLAKPGIGNTSRGTVATQAVNSYARNLLRSWLVAPVTVQNPDGTETTMARLFTLKNRALLRELVSYNPDGNFDRISAMGMLMLLREEKIILYQGDVRGGQEHRRRGYLGDDPFFTKNYRR